MTETDLMHTSSLSHSLSKDDTGWNTLRLRSGSVDLIRQSFSDKLDKSKSKSGTIGVFSLSVLVFYAVNGGAFGIEDIVGAGGPYFALVGELRGQTLASLYTH